MGQQQAITQYNQIEQLEESIIQTFLQKNKYQYQKVLGKGDFSQVVMAFSQKNQCQVAIKILKKLKDKNQVDLQDFEKEFQVLQKLKNQKYVLQIVEKIQDDKQGLAAIVTELCDCNLTTIFELNKLNIEQVAALSYQLLNSLLVLQENGVIHSDIKPDNILFSKSKNQFLIADYGLSKIMKDPSSQKTMASLQGNMQYQSPEVMNEQKPYTISVDVFSIGQLLVEAYIQRRLLGMEWTNLKSQKLLTVLPFLENYPNIEFVNKVLCKMVQPNKDNRLQPMALLQNIKSVFTINENSLKQLKVQIELPTEPQKQLNVQIKQPKESPKKFKRLQVNEISDIIKGKDYDELEINLNNNALGSDGAEKVSDALSKCPNITQLSLGLDNNGIGSDGAKKVSDALSKCPNITQLSLGFNNNGMGSDGAKKVFDALSKCPNITQLSLDLGNNGIRSNGAEKVSDALSKCPNITQLSLGLERNNIDENGAKSISDALRNFKSMIQLELDLNFNNIGREGAISIACALENYQSINQFKLLLYKNNIGDDGAKSIANVIRTYQNITSLNLDLRNNSISDDGAKNVANAIQNCQKITLLGLGLNYNNIGNDGAKSVANAIQNYKQITFLGLCLNENNISDDGAESVANAILNYQQITYLELQLLGNKIGDSGAESIVNAIQNYQKITSLDLRLKFNKISLGQKKLLENSLRSKFGGIQNLDLVF